METINRKEITDEDWETNNEDADDYKTKQNKTKHMYINYDHLFKKGLTEAHLDTLQKVVQKERILLEDCVEDFKILTKMELVSFVGKKKNAESIRLTKKGKAFMDQIHTLGYTDEIARLTTGMVDLYEANGKPVGKKLEIQDKLIWFISVTGFSEEAILDSTKEYIGDSGKYTCELSNLLWKAPNVFTVNKNLKNSKLYDYMCRRYNLDMDFFIEDKKGVLVTWLSAVSKLKLSKKIKPEMFFTGSLEGDAKHIEKIKREYLKQ